MVKVLNHRGTITPETKRLIMRRFSVVDTFAMFENWVNDADVTKLLLKD